MITWLTIVTAWFEAKVYTLGADLWKRIEFLVESVPNLGSIVDEDDEDGEILLKCNMWVMGQYGVVESWIKKTVALDGILGFFGCTESGQLLIEMPPGRMVSYDPESLYENNIGIPSPYWLGYTTDLMESLVLLDYK
ncbi:hypothetical protein SO802_008449 [Lithocarpus litseifolius]|uniref:Uncharacterized protein n=1 Tax=Lithocarpus litseifolius TaxID=425828 RepID=A0AAW2DAT7_9ROSI